MDCFVISPIGEEGSDTRKNSDTVLQYIIREALEAEGYNVARADTISESGIITSQIIERIVGADLVIADLTDQNPNVFYELAIRHMARKPFIHIIREGQRIPFDVSSSRTIFYSLELAGAKRAVDEIRRQAKSCRESESRTESPVSVALDLNELSRSENPAETAIGRIETELTHIRSELRSISDYFLTKARFVADSPRSTFLDALSQFGKSEIEQRGWTDERVEVLKSMWGAGVSASEISKALGGISRNGVIAKVHRLGLNDRATGNEDL